MKKNVVEERTSRGGVRRRMYPGGGPVTLTKWLLSTPLGMHMLIARQSVNGGVTGGSGAGQIGGGYRRPVFPVS